MLRLIAFGAAWSLAVGCMMDSGTAPALDKTGSLVEIGYTRGAMGTQVLVIREDGEAEYSLAPNRVIRKRLSPEDLKEVESLLSSGVARSALQDLRRGGYRPGRSDAPEIELSLGNKDRLGFAVCEDGQPLSSSVQIVIERLNGVVAKQFEGDNPEPFPIAACASTDPK